MGAVSTWFLDTGLVVLGAGVFTMRGVWAYYSKQYNLMKASLAGIFTTDGVTQSRHILYIQAELRHLASSLTTGYSSCSE
jgi:hypothetical protein